MIDVRWTSRPGSNPQVVLYPPRGGDHEASDSYPNEGSLDHALAQDGPYTIVIDSKYDYVGDYNLTLLNLQDDLVSDNDPDGGAILSGQTIAGTMDVRSDMDVYRFEGSQGDRILINTRWTSRSGTDPQIVLYPPNGGDHETADTYPDYGSLDHALAQNGLYTMVIDSKSDYTGEYNLTLLNLRDRIVSDEDPDGGPVLPGQTITGTLNVQSDMDAYKFEGSQGDRILIDARWTSRAGTDPQIVLYPPNSGEQEISDTYPHYGSVDHALEQNGQYTIVIDSRYDYVGEYNLTYDNINRPAPSFEIYVDATVSDPRADGTVEHPYNRIQDAIDVAREGASVILRPGIYTGRGNRDLSFYGKMITVRSVDPDDPNIVQGTVVACQSSPDTPHRAFSFLHGEQPSSRLEGITIEGGYAKFGAAIFCKESSPSIRNCIVRDCESSEFGGAIHCVDSSAEITNCQFEQNKARERGGGIYLGTKCSVVVSNCDFTGNSAGQSGGAIACEFNYFGKSLIQDCSIERNNASTSGGGLYCEDYHGMSIVGCDFFSNKCRDLGGGLYIAQSQSETYLEDCIISDNAADQASGAFIELDGTNARFGIGPGLSFERNDWLAEGNGLLHANPGSALALHQTEARLSCRMQGPCSIEVDAYSELHLEGDARVDLGGDPVSSEKGHLTCEGLLRLADSARLEHAEILVTRASFEDYAVVQGCVVNAEAGTPYGQFFVDGNVSLSECDIVADGDRYLDLDPETFNWTDESMQNISIEVNITEGKGGDTGGLFELRGMNGLVPPACGEDQFICQIRADDLPVFAEASWTIDRLHLTEGAKLNLTNRFDFQTLEDALDSHDEVLYVRDLVLDPNSVLNTAFNRVYYVNLDPDPTAQIVHVPLLGFSLNNISLDDEVDFVTRTERNNLYANDPNLVRVHVERVTGEDPDPNGMMRMCNLKDRDPDSPRYGEVINARAKGLFAKASEDQILIFFEYLFETSDPNTELVVYLSDTPGLLAHSDARRADHYVEVARLAPPPAGRPGSPGSGRFGVFQEIVSADHLDFVRGTRIELELMGPEGTCILVNDWDPQVQCYGICKDVTWDNFVDTQDFMTVIREYGLNAGLTADGNSRACLEGAFSQDGYVDLPDISGWDWTLNLGSRLNFCSVVPLIRENTVLSALGDHRLERPLPPRNPPADLKGLLVMGKGGAINVDMKLEDQLCILDHQGRYQEAFELPVRRGNTKLVMHPAGRLYQLSTEAGLAGLVGLPEEAFRLPPARLIIASDPRYEGDAVVTIGLQGDGRSVWGRPILDATFDAQGYLYVVPAVVHPQGYDPYLAAAKLRIGTSSPPPFYSLIRLYDDPPLPDDNQQRNSLREIEVDNEGRVYVTNAHHLNESDILWVFDENGDVDNRIGLVAQDADFNIPAPVALCASKYDSHMYLSSGQNAPDAVASVVYGLSTDTWELARRVTINGMGHITDITEDPITGILWVAGFTMAEIPDYPNPLDVTFYQAYLAEIPHGSNEPVDARLISPESDLALPMSILWVEGQAGDATR